MVSIRSLTCTFLRTRPPRWHSGRDARDRHRRHVVPPRPASARQPRSPRRVRLRRDTPVVRDRPRALGSGGAVPTGLPRVVVAGARRLAAAAPGPAVGRARRPGAAGRPGGEGGRRLQGARRRRLRPVRRPPGRAGRAGAGRARHRAGAHGLAVRRGAGPRAERLRRAVPGLLRLRPGLGRARLARPGRTAQGRALAAAGGDGGDPRPGAGASTSAATSTTTPRAATAPTST